VNELYQYVADTMIPILWSAIQYRYQKWLHTRRVTCPSLELHTHWSSINTRFFTISQSWVLSVTVSESDKWMFSLMNSSISVRSDNRRLWLAVFIGCWY